MGSAVRAAALTGWEGLSVTHAHACRESLPFPDFRARGAAFRREGCGALAEAGLVRFDAFRVT